MLSAHASLAVQFASLQTSGAELLLRARSGSHAYGLAMPGSDEDERGVFVLPARCYAELVAPPTQISDAKGDVVYHSVRRVFELLADSNPGMIELLYTPDDCILIKDPRLQALFDRREWALSQSLVHSLLAYAQGQIKKARGQNKWINQPQPENPPEPEQFCHVLPANAIKPGRAKPISELTIPLSECHVARVEHGGHLYRLYHVGSEARGVFRGGAPVCESIPIEIEQSSYLGLLMFNEQGFQRAKVDHQNYWHWRRERNPARWQQQDSGELDFDAKNLMHCLRLLHSAKHLVDHGAPLVRVDAVLRTELLAVRQGQFSYAELVERAGAMSVYCQERIQHCALPIQLDIERLHGWYAEIVEPW
jgi:uncharacterized protein